MKTVIKNGTIVNEGLFFEGDILIEKGNITKIGGIIDSLSHQNEINAEGCYVLPGCIDDQVHFREPGLTHKACIKSESRAAVAGGITSFMEMPNTIPNALTQGLLADKYVIASKDSIANYSFYMGASNNNLEEVLKTNPKNVCGVKVFMGSSTGNMLVDNEQTLNGLFANVPLLIATHCEDEQTIRSNFTHFKELYGENIPVSAHPLIRDENACYLSSSLAVSLAKKHGARLHVLHISTEKELSLFDNNIPLNDKKITAEACIHHLWFSDKDYALKGNLIKWNPAVKSMKDREAIWKAVLDDRIDVIATDHAPHTLEEKAQPYASAPSGGPLAQHALLAMLEKVKDGKIHLEKVVEKMAHGPAILFRIENRGFLREGYSADIVIVDPTAQTHVSKEGLLYQCGWSPFDGYAFSHKIKTTLVNGRIVWDNNKIIEQTPGQRLTFS
ncbi:MAG: dihydroorotase [Bacteroidetes bacterium]|nr:dihydroorotase [Bacteroidota bacterium]